MSGSQGNAKENKNELRFHFTGLAKVKSLIILSVSERSGQQEFPNAAGVITNVNYHTLQRNLTIPGRPEDKPIQWLCNITPGHAQMHTNVCTCARTHMYVTVFI